MAYVNARSLRAIAVLLPILGVLAVASRFACRYRLKSGFGIDDWLCIPTLVSFLSLVASQIWASKVINDLKGIDCCHGRYDRLW